MAADRSDRARAFFLKTNQSAHVINERGAVRFWQNGNVASGDGLVLVSLDDAGATRKRSRVAGAPCRRPAGAPTAARPVRHLTAARGRGRDEDDDGLTRQGETRAGGEEVARQRLARGLGLLPLSLNDCHSRFPKNNFN